MSRVKKYNSDSIKGKAVKEKKSKKRIIAVIILILLIMAGFFVYGFVNSKLNLIKREKFNKMELSCVDVDGYTNILLLGADARDMKSYKDARTDCIIIASINDKTKEVTLTSIYRDTLVKMGVSDKFDKITHAYFFGGAKQAIQSVNQALDLNIEKYVLFNFSAVADAVDSVGGINVPLKSNELSELNRVMQENNQLLGKNSPNVTEFGNVHINGTQALAFGRMRYGVGDDFKRNDRMRIVTSKLLDKFKKMSFGEANDVIDGVLPEIKTNLSNNDILTLAWNSSKYKITSSKGFPYHLKGGNHLGGYVNYATDLEADVIELHKNIFKQKDYKPTKKCIEISNRIKALSGSGGLIELEHLPQYDKIQPKNEVNREIPKQPIEQRPAQVPQNNVNQVPQNTVNQAPQGTNNTVNQPVKPQNPVNNSTVNNQPIQNQNPTPVSPQSNP